MFKQRSPPQSNRKAQAAITDLFIAVAVFIVLVTITTLIWNLYNVRLDSRIDYDNMVLKAYHISDTMLKSTGDPVNWERSASPINTINTLGLASDDHIISEKKLLTFSTLSSTQEDYDILKDKMNINLYDYYLKLKLIDGTPIILTGNAPRGKFAVNLARLVIYESEPHILEVTIWK